MLTQREEESGLSLHCFIDFLIQVLLSSQCGHRTFLHACGPLLETVQPRAPLFGLE